MIGVASLLASLALLAAVPASTNYELHDFGIGTGGTSGSDSTNYSLEGITGEQSGSSLSSTNYQTHPGFIGTQQADVPGAPTFTNPSNYYNKLHFVIDPDNNPSDAVFAIAISDDDFATTQYIQNDNTIGGALGTEDYQTYSAWGGGSGNDVVGLESDTTYKIKVKAMQGAFTETGFGPEASAATVDPQLTFDIDVSATDSETAPPYNLGLGELLPGTVTSGSDKIWLDFDTNAASGGNMFLSGGGSGLASVAAGYTVTSATADLAAASEGFGAQSATTSQGGGGPLTAVAPYNGGGDNVGIVDATVRQLYTSPSPITSGRASLFVKAKAADSTPAATDYAMVLTIIAAANY